MESLNLVASYRPLDSRSSELFDSRHKLPAGQEPRTAAQILDLASNDAGRQLRIATALDARIPRMLGSVTCTLARLSEHEEQVARELGQVRSRAQACADRVGKPICRRPGASAGRLPDPDTGNGSWLLIDSRTALRQQDFRMPPGTIPENMAQVVDLDDDDYGRILRFIAAIDARMTPVADAVSDALADTERRVSTLRADADLLADWARNRLDARDLDLAIPDPAEEAAPTVAWDEFRCTRVDHPKCLGLPETLMPVDAAQILDLDTGDYGRMMRLMAAVDGRMALLLSAVNARLAAVSASLSRATTRLTAVEGALAVLEGEAEPEPWVQRPLADEPEQAAQRTRQAVHPRPVRVDELPRGGRHDKVAWWFWAIPAGLAALLAARVVLAAL